MGRGADAAVRPAQARRSQGAGRVRVEAVAGPMPRRHRPAATDPIGNVEASVRLSMGRRHFCVVFKKQCYSGYASSPKLDKQRDLMEKVIMAAPRYDVKTIWLHWLRSEEHTSELQS